MLKTLTEKRTNLINDMQDNNYNANQIIAGLYSDPSHFIFEIIQNAEDTKATYINFEVFEDKLEVEHNGEEFNFKDIDAITTIGSSTKKDDVNKIGKFGAGFKSVFAITKSPEIHSGNFHFKITDFIIPNEIEPIPLKDKGTKIVLPFNNFNNIDGSASSLIAYKLQNLEMETLLFLNNINEIKWITSSTKGHYLKDTVLNKDFDKTFIIADENGSEKNSEYLIINDYVKIEDKNLKISVAFNIKDEKIIKCEQPCLTVFFPTKEKTNLNFLLHAPYKTTPNRETIPFKDEQNKVLTERLANLVAISLPILKSNNLLNVDTLKLLPLKSIEHNELYTQVFKAVKLKLIEDMLIPTNSNSFEKVENILLARGKELTTLLKYDDLNNLWNKNSWIDTNITYDKTRELRDYLVNELNIKEISYEDFARSITDEYITSKSDEWLIEFYYSLLNQEALLRDGYNKKGILKNKNIIRLDNDSLASLFDSNGKIQIYKPIKGNTKFNTVKPLFLENNRSKEFLEKYNVNYPDKIAELKEFIAPKYTSSDNNIKFEEYIEDIKKIIDYYNSRESNEKQNEIIEIFENKYIIYTLSNNLVVPSEAYLPTDTLKKWFENIDEVEFLISDLFNDTNKKFFINIGCFTIPKRKQIIPKLSNNQKQQLRDTHYKKGFTREIETLDYTIDGIESNIENITLENSIFLWSFLLEYDKLYSNWKTKFYQGTYKWFYYEPIEKKFETSFYKLLKSNTWIYDNNEDLINLENTTLNDINNRYDIHSENVDALENIFNFKSDEIKEFESNHPDKVIIDKNDFEEYKKYKEQQESDEKNINDIWEADVEPNEINDFQVDELDELLESEDLSNQQVLPSDFEDSNHTEDSSPNEPTSTPPSNTNSNNKIGDWGENFVNKILLKKYPEENGYFVNWLNKTGCVGKGYDFAIEKNAKEVLYIEVKSKTDSNPKLISITGTQWEWARELFNKDNGEMYEIYVVKNAGNKNAKASKISNPIKKWKDGKLKAHPVNFEL